VSATLRVATCGWRARLPRNTQRATRNAVLLATYQSTLAPAGPYAQKLHTLFLIFTGVSVFVWVTIIAAVLLSLRKTRTRLAPDVTEGGWRGSIKWVATAMSVTVVILVALLFSSVAVGRSVSPLGEEVTREIQITGHQWWWDVQYLHARPDLIAQGANELHLPVGERVKLILMSEDVIHSLWIPNLHGKRDLIPGHTSILTVRADVPGIYRAQCAEFCGMQHAKMAFIVVVEPRAEFEAWLNKQRLPAAHPKNADQQRGQQVFLTTSCAMCHAIKGTSAGARTGPDLTHIGSRRTLGAAVIPNNTGNLHGWISDPGSIKPGVLMPPNTFDPEDLHALVAYLESLK
jgi:cytochrome c oxidase subunit 2